MRKSIIIPSLIIIASLLSLFTPPLSHAATSSVGTVTQNELIVEYKPGHSPEELQQAINARQQRGQSLIGKLQNTVSSLTSQTPETELQEITQTQSAVGVSTSSLAVPTTNTKLHRFYLLHLKSGSNRQQAKQKLQQQSFIQSVSENQLMHSFSTAVTPNDTDYPYQWDMQKIHMPESWSLQEGSKSVIVAVVDTGIDFTQPDLPSDIIQGPNEIDPTASSADDFGHGTHIAGTIGALTNNSKGVSGMNWQVRLMSVKVLDSTGSGSEADMAAGIVDAVNGGAQVINLSMGGPGTCDSFLQQWINYALQNNVVVVAAAGNSNIDASQIVPASCPGVITVGASDQNDQRASFSDYGSRVDIAAPGTLILSTKSAVCNPEMCGANNQVDTNYIYASGTSMATPHVVGAAALLLASNPSLTPVQIKQCLVSSGDPITTDQPIGPRLNVYKALLQCGSSVSPTLSPSPTATTTPSNTTVGLDVMLHGLGNAGDSVNPGSAGNLQPLHPTRTVTLGFYGSNGVLISQATGSITLSLPTGNFIGNVVLGSGVTTGTYIIKISSPQFLTQQYTGFYQISSGTALQLPRISLTTGDVNGDNSLNLLDYNELMGCYSDLAPAKNCNATSQAASDLTDDGNVNQADYNLFLREISVRTGN